MNRTGWMANGLMDLFSSHDEAIITCCGMSRGRHFNVIFRVLLSCLEQMLSLLPPKSTLNILSWLAFFLPSFWVPLCNLRRAVIIAWWTRSAHTSSHRWPSLTVITFQSQSITIQRCNALCFTGSPQCALCNPRIPFIMYNFPSAPLFVYFVYSLSGG